MDSSFLFILLFITIPDRHTYLYVNIMFSKLIFKSHKHTKNVIFPGNNKKTLDGKKIHRNNATYLFNISQTYCVEAPECHPDFSIWSGIFHNVISVFINKMENGWAKVRGNEKIQLFWSSLCLLCLLFWKCCRWGGIQWGAFYIFIETPPNRITFQLGENFH